MKTYMPKICMHVCGRVYVCVYVYIYMYILYAYIYVCCFECRAAFGRRPRDLVLLLEAAELASGHSPGVETTPDPFPDPNQHTFLGRALLGIQVFAPHYHTAYAEVPLGPTEGPTEVIHMAEALAREHFHEDLSVIVPCRPQLLVGYASLVAQPACLAMSGNVVVILDLHAIEGNCFACVLPVSMEEDTLRAFAASLSEIQASDLVVHVGEDAPALLLE